MEFAVLRFSEDQIADNKNEADTHSLSQLYLPRQAYKFKCLLSNIATYQTKATIRDLSTI